MKLSMDSLLMKQQKKLEKIVIQKLNVLEVSKVEFEIIINPNFKIGIRDPEDTTISEALGGCNG